MWRRNPKPTRLKIKNGEIVLACQHASNSLFDQNFDEDTSPLMSVVAYKIHSDKEISDHRWYIACNICDAPESLEELLEKLYPTLGQLRISKRIRPLFDDWWLKNRPLVVNVNDLIRSHYIGEAPKVGDLVHMCGTADEGPFVYCLKFDPDDVTQMEAAMEGEELPAFTLLCPGCYTEASADDLDEIVGEEIWSKRHKIKLSRQTVIYKTLQDFIEYAEARDIPDEPDEDDLVLPCIHIDTVEDGVLHYIEESLNEMYEHPEEGIVVVSWLLPCEACNERHEGDVLSLFNELKNTDNPIIWGDEEDEGEEEFY